MNPMRFSAADWAFLPRSGDPGAYYDALKGLGYDGVEMVDPSRWARARSAGLAILNLSGPGKEKGLNRREHHAELLPQLREVVAAAGENGIPQVIIFSGARQGQPDPEGVANCRRGIEALLSDAERHRVTLTFEMFNTYDHPDYQADHGAYGFELVRQVGSPWLRIVYDIYHMARMGDVCARDITGNLPAIAHLHVADTPRRDRPRPGGQVDYASMVPTVMEAGYAGYWGMEFLPCGDPIGELAQARAWLLRAGERGIGR